MDILDRINLYVTKAVWSVGVGKTVEAARYLSSQLEKGHRVVAYCKHEGGKWLDPSASNNNPAPIVVLDNGEIIDFVLALMSRPYLRKMDSALTENGNAMLLEFIAQNEKQR